jgi:hypothetical protein
LRDRALCLQTETEGQRKDKGKELFHLYYLNR